MRRSLWPKNRCMQTNKNTHMLSSQAHIRPTKNKERKHKSHEKYKIKNKEENIKEAMKSIKSKDQNPLLK